MIDGCVSHKMFFCNYNYNYVMIHTSLNMKATNVFYIESDKFPPYAQHTKKKTFQPNGNQANRVNWFSKTQKQQQHHRK